MLVSKPNIFLVLSLTPVLTPIHIYMTDECGESDSTSCPLTSELD